MDAEIRAAQAELRAANRRREEVLARAPKVGQAAKPVWSSGQPMPPRLGKKASSRNPLDREWSRHWKELEAADAEVKAAADRVGSLSALRTQRRRGDPM